MRFSHLGLVVADIDMMQDFYTDVLGFELTDRGVTGQGATMAFMTLDPFEHHQVFLVDGRPDGDLPSNTIISGASPVLHVDLPARPRDDEKDDRGKPKKVKKIVVVFEFTIKNLWK